MAPDPNSPAGRILATILTRRRTATSAVQLLSIEAERTGLVAAIGGLTALVAGGWAVRWEMPAEPGKPAERDVEGVIVKAATKGREEVLAVALTPWALERLRWRGGKDGEDVALMVVENQTGKRCWYDWEGEQPDCYRLPVGDRMPSIEDPRMAAFVNGLGTKRGEDEDDDTEYLMDRQTGDVAMVWGRPIAIAESWAAAERAASKAAAQAGGLRGGMGGGDRRSA